MIGGDFVEEKKFRHEIKHYINMSDYLSIRNRLIHIMHIDKNANKKNEYIIRSLYFDNLDDKVLMEKSMVLIIGKSLGLDFITMTIVLLD